MIRCILTEPEAFKKIHCIYMKYYPSMAGKGETVGWYVNWDLSQAPTRYCELAPDFQTCTVHESLNKI